MTRRAGLYVRLSLVKSTEELTEDATERQEDRARAYCQAKGWDVVRVYADVDISAYRAPGQKAPPRREDFEQALEDVEAGVIDALVFFKLDRFVRDHGDFERALRICEQHGAVLASVVEPIDTSSPAGEMAARMLVGFARLESQTVGLRVAAQREQAARKGLPSPGGWRSFGYTKDGTTVDEAEAEIVREAARRVLAGEALNSIARDLTRRGFRAADGSGAFYTRRLKRILLAPRVAGLRAYKGEVIREATWPAILPRQTWEAVKGILEAPERRRGGHPPRWPLAGLLVCGTPGCETPLKTKGNHGRIVYACDPTRPGFKGCGKIQIDARHAEQIVLKMIAKRDWRRLAGTLRELTAATLPDPGLAEQLAADEIELRSLARQRALRKISEPEWLEMREALTDRIAAARAQLERRAAVPPEALDGSKPIMESWPKWTVEQQRAVLRAIFKRLVILPATKRGRGEDPDRVHPDWRV